MSSVKKNFIYNSFYQILIMVIPLITTPYISRTLGSGGVGTYSYYYSIAYYFMIFSMMGLNNYGNRTIASVRDDKDLCSKKFLSIYSLQCITSLVMLMFYALYVFFICENKEMGLIMSIFVFSSLFDINWFYFGLEKFKLTVVRNSLIKVITVLCIFIFVKNEEDIYIYALIYALGTIFSQFYLCTQIKKYVDFVRINKEDIIEHIKPNLILFIPVIAVSLYKYMDKIMLGMLTNKEQVGLYESCEKVVNIPLGLIVSLGTIMLPRVTNLMSNKRQEIAKSYFYDSIAFAMFLATSMSFGIMSVSRELVPVFFGPGYEGCIYIFMAIMPSCLFVALANVLRTQYLIPQKKDSIYIFSVISGAVVNLIVNFIFIKYYQAVGAAIGTLCAEAAVCFIQYFFVRKEISIKKILLISYPFLFSGASMFLVLNFIIKLESSLAFLCLKILIGVIVYIISLVPFICFNKQIRYIFVSLLKSLR